MLLTVIVAVTALSLFVSRTTTGKSMRAVAADSEIASLMGIRVDRVIVTTFAIGGCWRASPPCCSRSRSSR